ncbi:MAG: gliding motility-associated C-terminal domain-containing protein, partial [Flavobacteriales bacterium]
TRPFYDGLRFHRAQDDFIIQAGNPTGAHNAGPGWRIARETGANELFAEPALTVTPIAFAALPDVHKEPVAPAILAPSAFTPDGDGLNDKYFPRILGMDIAHCRFEVFDRWGRPLYATTTPDDGWDGTMGRAGAAMPQGVYVWLLEAQLPGCEEAVRMAGTVTLIR